MTKSHVNEIRAKALAEIAEEDFRNRVNEEKEKIRNTPKYLFPWKLVIKFEKRK